MNIKALIAALRVGQSIGNESAWKWAGFVGLASGLVFQFAQSRGWINGVSESDWVELVSGVLSLAQLAGLYTIVATTEKIGLPPRRDDDASPPPYRRMRDELPTDNHANATKGFPSGPFFDS